jgi:hypothetical protein
MSALALHLRRFLQRVLTRRADTTVTAFRVRLRSKVPEAHFQVLIQMEWPPGRQVDQVQCSLAEQHLLRTAQAVAENYSVLDPDEARGAIDLQLFWNLRSEGAGIHPAAARVIRIEVGPDDRHLAEAQEALRRQTALAQVERSEEAKRLRILGDDILTNPTLTRLWWLEGKPDKLKELVKPDTMKVFEDVAELFNAPAERVAADPISELIRIFLGDLDAQCREQLISQLQFVFRSYERHDLVGNLDTYQHPPAPSSGEHGSTGDFDGRAPVSPAL